MPDYLKARERSVSNLQRLYVIVVSLGIAYYIRHLVEVINEVGIFNILNYYNDLFMFISYIFIVVPFFHGANRYLDATYVTGERSGKTYGLLIDFVALFAQGLVLFVLAIVSSVSREVFYTTLVFLLVLDIIWVGLTYFTADKEHEERPKFTMWASINIIAVAALLVSVWSNLFNWEFWHGEHVKNIMLLAIVVTRTVFDYLLVWDFYYPPPDGFEQTPAPLPAPPPSRVNGSED